MNFRPTQLASTVLTLCFFAGYVSAQTSSYEAYKSQFQNRLGVADTLTEKLLAQRQAIRAGYDVQAMEGPVDPATYKLGPGDGIYLNVYAAHSLDQDLTVTPEGRIIIPRTGQVDVAGLTVPEAEKKINSLLLKDYKEPNASISLRKLRSIKISVLGDVLAPGMQTATALSRVSELIDKSGGFVGKSSLRNIEVRDQTGKVRVTADLVRYLVTGDLASNPLVESGDVIVVPRAHRYVIISGSVGDPGQKEFVKGEKLSTLLRVARGTNQDARLDSVEIARFLQDNPSRAERFYVNFLAGEDPDIHDGDVVSVRGTSQYHIPRVVAVGGEVVNPGKYSIELGATHLLDVIKRAGGILPSGSLEEAVVLRRAGTGSWEADPEYIMIQQISAADPKRVTDDQYNYYMARTRQLGRSVMVVNFKSLIEKNDVSQDILLRDEDSVWIPRARGFVSVIGSVNSQGNIAFTPGMRYKEYIAKAGGYTSSADRSQVRVINSKTSSYINPSSDSDYELGPGDTIVIPAEHPTFWEDFGKVTAITAQVITIFAGIFLLAKK